MLEIGNAHEAAVTVHGFARIQLGENSDPDVAVAYEGREEIFGFDAACLLGTREDLLDVVRRKLCGQPNGVLLAEQIVEMLEDLYAISDELHWDEILDRLPSDLEYRRWV